MTRENLQRESVIEKTTGENLNGNRSGNRESKTGIGNRETGIEKRESRIENGNRGNDRGESKTVIETTGENLNGNRESKTGIENRKRESNIEMSVL